MQQQIPYWPPRKTYGGSGSESRSHLSELHVSKPCFHILELHIFASCFSVFKSHISAPCCNIFNFQNFKSCALELLKRPHSFGLHFVNILHFFDPDLAATNTSLQNTCFVPAILIKHVLKQIRHQTYKAGISSIKLRLLGLQKNELGPDNK